MSKNIVRNAMKNFCICLGSLTLLIGFAQAQERRVFSAAERKADEIQIQKDIASYLEWALFGLENTDLGEMNQSISFDEKEKKRFGIFEAFNEKNQKIFEIRLHQKGQLIGRYLPNPHACTNGSLLVLDRKRSYSTFEFDCGEPGTGRPNTWVAFYVYHHDSNNFYEIYDAEVGDKFYGHPSVNFSNDIYQFKWTHSLRGKAATKTVVRNFKIVKVNNQWVVQSSSIAKKDDYVISILSMLLLDPKYNLPKVFDLTEAVAEAEETEHCMPRQQMAINGVTIFTKESEVLKKLGAPEKKTNGWGHGTTDYRTTTYSYAGSGLRVVIDNSQGKKWVDDLVLASDRYSLPSGIKVGIKKDVVAKLLKLPRKKKKEIFAENTWQVSLCEDKTGMFMTVGPIFSFSDHGVLQKIRFEYTQP